MLDFELFTKIESRMNGSQYPYPKLKTASLKYETAWFEKSKTVMDWMLSSAEADLLNDSMKP